MYRYVGNNLFQHLLFGLWVLPFCQCELQLNQLAGRQKLEMLREAQPEKWICPKILKKKKKKTLDQNYRLVNPDPEGQWHLFFSFCDWPCSRNSIDVMIKISITIG